MSNRAEPAWATWMGLRVEICAVPRRVGTVKVADIVYHTSSQQWIDGIAMVSDLRRPTAHARRLLEEVER